MKRTGRTFRVFISSTFTDFKAERDALRKDVFPKLRELCSAHGARFQPVDLRWGVSKEAALNQQVLDICLQEVQRCLETSRAPNFVALIGDRYGSYLAPSRIPATRFRRIKRAVHDYPDAGLLSDWYTKDGNARPAVFLLNPRTAEYSEYKIWSQVEGKILALLRLASERFKEPAIAYDASATELEIEKGIFELRKNGAYCYFRTLRRMPKGKARRDFMNYQGRKRDAHASQRLAELKQRLREHLPTGHIFEYDAKLDPATGRINQKSLDTLCERVIADLSQSILMELGSIEGKSRLDEEIDAHADFCANRSRHFYGRGQLVDNIVSQIRKGKQPPLIVFGESGSGKSAIIAKVSRVLAKLHPDVVLIQRFVGATPRSMDVRSLLEDICREIARAYNVKEKLPATYTALVELLPNLLAHATKEKPLVVLFDALDQLSTIHSAHDLSWLPVKAPPHAGLCVSVLQREGPPGKCLRSARTIFPKNRFKPLAPLGKEEGEAILNVWLKEAGRTLTPTQKDDLLKNFQSNGLPLYLKIGFEEARRWRSFDGLPCGADDVPGLNNTVKGVLYDMLARLEAPEQHGAILVERCLGYLAASRNGLTDDEMVGVLSADKRYVMRSFRKRSPESPPTETLPPIVWSRLYFDLAPYLTEQTADNASLLTFYHRSVREAVEERYLSGSASHDRSKLLARTFVREPNWFGRKQADRMPNYRKASEMIFQLIRAQRWDKVGKALTNVDLLRMKCEAGMVFDLVSEYGSIQGAGEKSETGPHVDAFAEFIRSRAHLLAGNPGLFLEMAYDWSNSGAVAEAAAAILEGPRRRKHRWIRRFDRRGLGTQACLQTMAEHSGRVTSVAIAPNRPIVYSGSDDKKVKVWDANTGHCLKTMEGHKGAIKAMAISPDGNHLVTGATDGRVGIWDLRTRNPLRFLSGHKRTVCSVLFTQDGKFVVTGSEPTTKKSPPVQIRIWELGSLKPIQSFQVKMRSLQAITLGPEGESLLVGGHDGIQLWDLKTESCVWSKMGWEHTSRCMAVRPRGGLFVNGSSNLHFRRLSDGEERKSIGYGDLPTAVVLTANGNVAVSADLNKEVKVWDLKSRTLTNSYRGHNRTVYAIAVSADGTRAVSGSDDNTVKLWDLTVASDPERERGEAKELGGIVKIPHSDRVITAGEFAEARIWSLATHDYQETLFKNKSIFKCFAITHDGKRLVTAGQKGIGFWELSSGEKLREIAIEASHVHSLALSPCGTRAFVANLGGEYECWSLDSGKRLWRRKGHGYSVHSVRCNTDGSLLFTSGWEGGVKVRDPASGRVIRTLKQAESNIYSIAIAPRNNCVVAGGRSGKVEVFDAIEGKCLWSYQRHDMHVWSVSVTPDGSHVVSGGTDANVIVANLVSGEEVARYIAPAEIRHCLVVRDREIMIADVHGNVDFLELV